MADDSLKTWKEKLDFLEKEAALAVDAEAKFALGKRVEEARQKIEELEHARERQPQVERPRYADEEAERLSVELEGLFEERERLALDEGDTRVLDRRINDVRRLLRKGPQLRAGEFLADGRFKLVEFLGQGGFATVWKAYDRQLRRVVAIKVLHGQHSHERTKQERFFRGARRMAELRHPHVVDVLEKEVDDEGWLFFVMEYVAGGDFRRAVLDGTLSTEEKIGVVLQVGEALAFAHGLGIVHRDVKPGNVLLEQKDRKWTAKLTDFDLVRAEDSTGFTATRAMMGTLQFAAPEALTSARAAGPRADVYSLGSTAVFALRGETLPEGYYRDPRPAVSALDVSEDLKRVLGRATSMEAAKRYSSVEEFCEALRAAVRPAAAAVPESESDVVQRPAEPSLRRARRQLWLLGSAVVFLAVVLLAWSLRDVFLGNSDPGEETAGDVEVVPPPNAVKSESGPTKPLANPLRPSSDSAAEPDNPKAGDRWTDPATGITLHYIPDGTFTMGSPPDEPGYTDREVQHGVKLTRGFWMGETEVTQSQWKRFMKNNPSDFKSCDSCPVETVSWFDAVAFANVLSKEARLEVCYQLDGCEGTPGEHYSCKTVVWKGFSCEGYRLPTEAEWEYAARAGTTTAYWMGPALTAEQANFGGSVGRTAEVGSYAENPWGLYDVHGNVWEWVWDWYGVYPTDDPPALIIDPNGRGHKGSGRVYRGGSWISGARNVRAAYRNWRDPGVRYVDLGFRLARGQGAPGVEPR